MLLLTLIFGLLYHGEPALAATKPSKPKISVKASKDGSSVTITIKKTKNADGYLIEAKMPGAKKYTAVKTVELNGKKKRNVTVDTLTSGKYSFRVKAYAKDGSSNVWGKYSKVKKITVNNSFNPESLGISQGDIVTFGACDQDGVPANGKEPIDWIVLSNNNGKLFMVSVFVLEKGVIDDTGYEYMYDDDWDDDDWDDEDEEDEDDETGADNGKNTGNTENSDENAVPFDGTWKNSKLRKHLNEEFLTSAFSEKEIAFIADTELTDSDCTDKVFLLSKEEVTNAELGFERQEDRICAPASYGLGVWTYDGDGDYGKAFLANVENISSCYWWLRTPYADKECDNAFCLMARSGGISYNSCWGEDYDTSTGYEDEPNIYVEDGGFGVRPALMLNLKNGIQEVLTKTGKTMKEEWANAGYDPEWYEDDYLEWDDDTDYYLCEFPEIELKDISEAQQWDSILFGSYEQDNDTGNGKEPIEWIVLSRTDTELFVMSRYAIEALPFHNESLGWNKGATWENCWLRSWLNDDFLKAAFTKSERKKIKTTDVINSYSSDEDEDVNGGNDTKDKVFLLSDDEVYNKAYGFSKKYEDMHRACIATPYVEAKEVYTSYYHTSDGRQLCDWILRTPGYNDAYTCYIVADGFIKADAAGAKDSGRYGIRPAMVISIK